MDTDRNYCLEVKGFSNERTTIDICAGSIFEATGALVRILEVVADAHIYNAEYLTIEASARPLDPPPEAVTDLQNEMKRSSGGRCGG